MTQLHPNNLKQELKELIISECERDCSVSEVSDDGELFGPNSTLQLDSIDALQISMALHKKYGVKITDSKKLRKVMASINTLAKYIENK
jgi:acyl carrier protein